MQSTKTPLFPWKRLGVSPTQLRHLSRVLALLALTGRVQCWACRAGEKRAPASTVFWSELALGPDIICLPRRGLLLAGDETTITKAGVTPGDWIASSPRFTVGVPGLRCSLWWPQGVSHPMRIEQVIKTDEEKQAAKTAKTAKAASCQNRQSFCCAQSGAWPWRAQQRQTPDHLDARIAAHRAFGPADDRAHRHAVSSHLSGALGTMATTACVRWCARS